MADLTKKPETVNVSETPKKIAPNVTPTLGKRVKNTPEAPKANPAPKADPVREKIMKQGFAPKGWKAGDDLNDNHLEETDEVFKKTRNRFENPAEYYNSLPEESFWRKYGTVDDYIKEHEESQKYGGPFSDYAGEYSDVFKDEHGYRPRGDYDGILQYAAKSLGVQPGTRAYEYLKQKMEEFKKFHNHSDHYSY